MAKEYAVIKTPSKADNLQALLNLRAEEGFEVEISVQSGVDSFIIMSKAKPGRPARMGNMGASE
jgi:hypothetical protein